MFDDVFADIGDEQSLEQNLSTFSGHMQNIAAILNSAGKRSLVLLDELGSGTDPQEGGALARAILDELVDRRPFTVVTTHHGVLKHYGYTRPTAGNASVEFDPTSLRPTYHIVPGVPGASHAVEIAAGQGIPNPIIAAADGYLTGEEQDVASIIRRLTTEEQRLRERETELESTMEQLQQQRAQLEESATDLDRRERELRAAKLREFDQFSAEARRRLENLVRELRETEITRKRTGEVKEFISELDEYAGTQRANLSARLSARETTSPRNPDATANAAEPRIGDRVEILSTRKTGTVQRAGKGNTWIIQAGALKLPVPAGDLRVLEPARLQRGPEVEYSGSGGAHAPLELDLRGKRLAEAVDEVDRQIDAALLSGLSQFSIIHGTGGGVLQTGVRDLLASNPHVASFTYAHPEQGGFGKTVVTLSGA